MTQDFLRLWGGLLLVAGAIALWGVIEAGFSGPGATEEFGFFGRCTTGALALWGMAKAIDLLVEIGAAKKAKAAEG